MTTTTAPLACYSFPVIPAGYANNIVEELKSINKLYKMCFMIYLQFSLTHFQTI